MFNLIYLILVILNLIKQCKSERNDINLKKTDKINSDDLDFRTNDFYFDETYDGPKNVNYPNWNIGKSSNISKIKLSIGTELQYIFLMDIWFDKCN